MFLRFTPVEDAVPDSLPDICFKTFVTTLREINIESILPTDLIVHPKQKEYSPWSL
jgi:hypothetical protein